MPASVLVNGTYTCAEGSAVATAGVPAAAEVAISLLADGGNAFDAAVAACLVESVWLPMKCGPAGDLVALVLPAGGSLRALVSIGAAGRKVGPDSRLSVVGPSSVGVPGAPDGYATIAELATRPLGELAAPAIDMARRGVVWLPLAVQLTRESEALLRIWNGPNRFLPGGRLPVAGERLHLPGLASVFERFAAEGHRLFHGELGARVATRVTGAGGLLGLEDLQQRPAMWDMPRHLDLGDGSRLSVTPNPTHGPILLEAVDCAYRGNVDAYEAFARTMATPRLRQGGTSVVCVADRSGNAIVVVHSNSFPQYGAAVLVEELDLVLNNRPGRGFDLDANPSAPDAPMPGRQPHTTLHAWSYSGTTGTWLGATPGGKNQVAWNLQTLLELLRDSMDICDVVQSPRWSVGSSGGYLIEANHAALTGFDGEVIPARSQRSGQQILALGKERRRAAADPRTGAVALSLE